jgi:GntR family transcriptional regulator
LPTFSQALKHESLVLMAPMIEASKTQKLYLVLRHRIICGELEAGARLPSEPDLGTLHKVSRVTVRRALDQLEKEGLILRQPGAGTFVASCGERRPVRADLTDALAQLGQMGRNTGLRLLSFDYVQPGAVISEALNLAPGERAQKSIRVRTLDGEPFSYLITHVPESIGSTYSESDLASTPLLMLLERSNVFVDRALQTIAATLAAPDIADALDVSVGSALLTLQRLVSDASGRGIEHLQAYYRPDRHTFQLELVRSGKEGHRRWATRDKDASKAETEGAPDES